MRTKELIHTLLYLLLVEIKTWFLSFKNPPTTIPKIPGLNHLPFVTFRAGGLACLFRLLGSRDKISNSLRATFPANVGHHFPERTWSCPEGGVLGAYLIRKSLADIPIFIDLFPYIPIPGAIRCLRLFFVI